jgi:hypothetical protein
MNPRSAMSGSIPTAGPLTASLFGGREAGSPLPEPKTLAVRFESLTPKAHNGAITSTEVRSLNGISATLPICFRPFRGNTP